MKITSSIEEIKNFSQAYRNRNPQKKLSLVPTMGMLHKGHLSLIRKAKEQSDCVIASIFVNPIQFNQKDDFDQYPRDLEQDQSILKKHGVDVLFVPKAEDIFHNKRPRLRLSVPDFEKTLCSPFRPAHFEGVLMIVYLLLSWVQPHLAVFGLKDYQQYLYIKTMVEELHLPVRIVGVPTVREPSGLALSSRNERLSSQGKKDALVIYKSLKNCEKNWQKGARVKDLRASLQNDLKDHNVEYADIYSTQDLSPLEEEILPQKALLAAAALFEGVRLIDNIIVGEIQIEEL